MTFLSKRLVETLTKAKKDYSEITKIIFYTNQEWAQYKGGKPKGLKEIENYAKGLNVILEWKAASFFESEFVTTKNEIFARHFFSLEKSILVLIEDQKNHTENILNQIKTEICFNRQNIEINRNEQILELTNTQQQISILSGVGGVGKTAIIKNIYEKLKEKETFIVFKATEFELRHINDLYVGFDFYDFVNIYKDKENKTIVIDSAEKLLDLKNHDPFKEFLSILITKRLERNVI